VRVVLVWLYLYSSGQCTIELSRHEDFHTICRQGVVKVEQGTDYSAIVEFDDLDSSTTWYYRTYLHNPRKGFDGAAAGFSVKGISTRAFITHRAADNSKH